MPTVLVDGRPFSAAWASSGTATYLRGLLPALARQGFEIKALVSDDAATPDAVQRVPVRRLTPDRGRYLEQLVRLPGDIARSDADVFHSPSLDPPARSRLPWMQTLHDLIPLMFEDTAYRGERRRWRSRLRRIAGAGGIVAVSHHTARLAVERGGLAAERVQVAHHGLAPDLSPPVERPVDDPPYVLYVSSLAPHKGYREAFGVLSLLADAGHPHRLKMVGGMWKSEAQRVRSSLDDLGPWRGRIEFLDRVPRADLVRLYQGAQAVIVTSRYEGFGLPAVEAMATATPVVAFDNSSLPEVVGDGGVLVPDGDVEAFARALGRLLGDVARWSDASAAALARAAHFSWDASARIHAEVLRACIAGERR